jgi:spectinomycin phosphotransferase/16S rRNA (guanine(1405)-N(7))-methyltransferase
MLTRPPRLSDGLVAEALRMGWDLAPVAVEYRPLGFGSHHWEVTASGGARWFVTVDDLGARLRTAADTRDAAYQRLAQALRTARALSEAGASFVVAPVRAPGGDVLARIGGEYALAVYPHLAGQAGSWGDTLAEADRQATVALLTQVHAAPRAVCDGAGRDDFLLTGADGLRGALGDLTRTWDSGPYAEPARRLLGRYARDLQAMLGRRDHLADQARARPERLVLTHGEPHPGNLIRAGHRWMLIDWDTVLVAPPERDLWLLDSGGGSIGPAYRELTGREVLPSALDLYRRTWALTDIALGVARFYGEHGDTRDDRMDWQILSTSLADAP